MFLTIYETLSRAKWDARALLSTDDILETLIAEFNQSDTNVANAKIDNPRSSKKKLVRVQPVSTEQHKGSSSSSGVDDRVFKNAPVRDTTHDEMLVGFLLDDIESKHDIKSIQVKLKSARNRLRLLEAQFVDGKDGARERAQSDDESIRERGNRHLVLYTQIKISLLSEILAYEHELKKITAARDEELSQQLLKFTTANPL